MPATSISLLMVVAVAIVFPDRLAAQAIAPAERARTVVVSPVERLGPNALRVGNVRVDLAKKEISVDGTITNAQSLEFVANTKDGFKAYESAIELDTTAVNFNTALILTGLDPSHAVPPTRHFDPSTPKGDPVEIWVDWDDAGQRRSVRAEELVYNDAIKQTLAEGPWVYTGSVFVNLEERKQYLAEVDGVLIGFVHTPAPVIESPRQFLPEHYGYIHLNPALKLTPGTKVTVRVRSLPGTTK